MEWVFCSLAAVCAGLVLFLLKIATTIWWKPLQVKKSFEAQGIRGPPYRLFYGNCTDISTMIEEQQSKPMPLSHDILPRVYPIYINGAEIMDFIFWFGTQARLVVPHPELIKEILSTKFGNYTKVPVNPLSRQLFGQGLAGLTGEKWAQHRKIINPAFHMDLLQVEVNLKSNTSLTTEEIIDECKTFYFGGHETTSLLLTWSIVLLGIHQDWQERGRRDVMEVCGTNNYPDADSLSRLKIVGMIVNEALRLYPPLVGVLRQACVPTKLGGISIPVGTQLELPIIAIHHDPALWGDDANEFNPGRFSEGIAKAPKHPMAFMPFGTGPTICVGQNFALLEAKLVLAMILQKFYFVISPSYTHAPLFLVTVRPQYGAQIILHISENNTT